MLVNSIGKMYLVDGPWPSDFKGFEILQGHGLLVDGFGSGEDLLQARQQNLRTQCLRLFVAFGVQDVGLLRAFALSGWRPASRLLPR